MSAVSGDAMRAVLDTNVLVSALTRSRGRLASLWPAARQRRYRLVLSPAIVREIAEVLRRDFGWPPERLIPQLKALVRAGELIRPDISIAVITEDPDDNRILECAVAGHADLIVSGDRHLLQLKSYDGIPIVRPVDFRRTLGLTG